MPFASDTAELNPVNVACMQMANERDIRFTTQRWEASMEKTEDENQHYLAKRAQDCAINEGKCQTRPSWTSRR